jgi:hypothetical protein
MRIRHGESLIWRRFDSSTSGRPWSAAALLHASYHTTRPSGRGFLCSARSPKSPFVGPASLVVLSWTPWLQPSTCVAPYTCTELGPTRTAPALGIDAYAQQVHEANLETLKDPLSAGDDHDNP